MAEVLRKLLLMCGVLIVVTSVVADFLSFKGMMDTISEFANWNYPETKEIFASFLTGIFQGIGLGLLCIYASHRIRPFGKQ